MQSFSTLALNSEDSWIRQEGNQLTESERIVITTPAWAMETPHLRELYDAMEGSGTTVRAGTLKQWVTQPKQYAGQRVVFHLNWLDHLASRGHLAQRVKSALRLLVYLLIARVRRRNIWWTIHNVEPHEYSKARIFAATQLLAFHLVSMPHFLSNSAQDAFLMKYRRFGVSRVKSLVTPLPTSHSRFTPAVPNHGDSSHETATFLLFGILRRAKAVVETINSFGEPSLGYLKRSLVVIGEPDDEAYRREILLAAQHAPNVRAHLVRQSNAELADALSSADWGVFLYRKTSNSGALVAAMSAGLPVLATETTFFSEEFGEPPHPGQLVPLGAMPTGSDWDAWAALVDSPTHEDMRKTSKRMAERHDPEIVASLILSQFEQRRKHNASGSVCMPDVFRSIFRRILDVVASRSTSVSSARTRRYARIQAQGPEPELRLAAALTSGVQFVDVGANIGMFTAIALDSGASSVIAVEPIPELASRLKGTFGNRIKVISGALSSEAGTATLTIPLLHGVRKATRASLESDTDSGVQVQVSLTTLDSLDLQRDAMVKIDVEGHEPEVLRGARSTLEARTVRAWLIEAEERNRLGAVSNLVELMTDYRYIGWAVTPDTLIPVAEFDSEIHQSMDDQEAVIAGSGRPRTYANNFCFVREEDVDILLAAAEAHGFRPVTAES